MRTRRRRLVAAALIVASSLVLAELLLIVLEPVLPLGMYRYDAELGFRGRPYRNGTNRFGFNDLDHPLERAPGSWRVVLVNDSFGWEGGPEDNYTALLEQRLVARYGAGKAEVVNVGYPGTGTAYQLPLLRRYGLPYQPDVVLLGFFAGNDYLESFPHSKKIIVNDIMLMIDDRELHTLLGYPVMARSRLVDFIGQKIHVWRNTNRDRTGVILDRFLGIEWERLDLSRRTAIDSHKYQAHVDHALAAVRDMALLCRAHGIDFRVAIYPDRSHLEPELRQQLYARYHGSDADFDLEWPQRRLIQQLEADGIPYLDLTAPLAHARVPLYDDTNTHWNPAGRALAAQHLEDFLVISTASRRAAPKPDQRFRAPLATPRPWLTLRFSLPEASMAGRKQVELRARVNGRPLAPERYQHPGDYTYQRPLDGEAQQPLEIDFSIDPPFIPGGADSRQLGVIVWSAALELR